MKDRDGKTVLNKKESKRLDDLMHRKVVIKDNESADKLIGVLEKPGHIVLVSTGNVGVGKSFLMEKIMEAVKTVNDNSPTTEELANAISVVSLPPMDNSWQHKYEQDWHEEFFNNNFTCRKCKLDFHDCTCFDNPMDKRRFLRALHNYWYR